MCLAVPAEVIEINNGVATCRVGEGSSTVNASLLVLDEDVELGDYVIIHAGFAIRKLDPQEAQESLQILRELVQAAEEAGMNVDQI
ncbi:hydrogenase expression/formation protein HypC [Paucidesulfovibrio gracilis DSM 16080]|uniref:Hydrogenase expression/formation protein HypC n=1 Tax=Paucidesulfovibrio gracilis DSM 16080 TaxID=1121449 RepID=A0A1T4W3G5_9BACT|nr:HypC/HybG/HupF family hydrogenase formation chaperone [Paucidesulfovibrio gracilis]SKA71689.1 hydrogenase expression/formation protein HypC [Paucidesulfovibrio gracilis DSM 16080]